jgi:flagellar biogenesis protein FliO
MSRRIKESNLEQAVTPADEIGALPAVAYGPVKAKRTAVNKGGRVERQSRLAERSTKATHAGSATMTKSKNANRTKSKTKSSLKTRTVKMKAVVPVNVREEKTTAADETILGVEVERQVQVLSQSIGESADVKPRDGLGSSPMREMCFEAEIVVPDVTIPDVAVHEKNDVSVSLTDELEVITDHVHLHQAAEKRSMMTLRWLAGAWKWAQRLGSRHPRKRLRVCETVALGEKRFVAVIEVDGEQFLVGGGSTSVATLARLEPTQQFSDVLKRRWAQEPVQA